ncbi:hypothetical protein D3C75_135790 [compost metagenome]
MLNECVNVIGFALADHLYEIDWDYMNGKVLHFPGWMDGTLLLYSETHTLEQLHYFVTRINDILDDENWDDHIFNQGDDTDQVTYLFDQFEEGDVILTLHYEDHKESWKLEE